MVGLTELAEPQAARALRRPAAARRARPRARDQAEGAAARRAARRPRPAAPAAHARRAAQPPAPARADVHPRHAQPGRGAVDGRPDRRHERGADPAGRRPADDRDASRRPSSSRASWATTTSSAARSSSATGGRLVVEDEHGVRASVQAPGDTPAVGDAGAGLGPGRGRRDRATVTPRRAVNSAECEIVFVEFLGDLVKLHLTAGGERLLAKVPGERYPGASRPRGRADQDLLEGGGCPAPLRLSPAPRRRRRSRRRRSSRARDRPERALGEQGGTRGKGGGWVTLRVGLARLRLARLLPRRAARRSSSSSASGRGPTRASLRHWTGANYGALLHPFNLSNSYWENMLTSFETSLIAVAACLVFGFPVAYFLAMKVEKLQNQIALFIIALAPFWTSFLTRSVAWAYPLMGREGALNQFLAQAAHRQPAGHRVRLLDALGAARDDPALHPVHGHAALLPARSGRPARDRGGARPRRQLVQRRSRR